MHGKTLIGGVIANGREYQAISSGRGSTVLTVILMLLCNAKIMLRRHAADGRTRLRKQV